MFCRANAVSRTMLALACLGSSIGFAEEASTPTDQTAFVSLFNGADLKGWYTYLQDHGKNSDPQRLIQIHDGLIHIYKDAEAGKPMPLGYLCTEAEYAHYHLRLEYKWGEKKFIPYVNAKRDAGVLYHVVGPDGVVGVWPRSNEFQIQETDTGDITTVLIRCSSTIDGQAAVTPPRFLPAAEGGVPRMFGDFRGIQYQSKRAMYEVEGWNTIDLVVRGDAADYYVNGKLVNQCTKMEQPDPQNPGQTIPLDKGRIVLQVEGAEVFYRNVVIKPLETASAKGPSLSVGAGIGSFTADDSMQIAGSIGPGHVKGQEGDLRAVAIVLEQPGSQKIAIVGCDVLFVTRAMIDKVAAQVEKSCGIPSSNLLVNATHTHHAPSTVRIHGTEREPAFIQSVEEGIAKAVEEANRRLTPGCQLNFSLNEQVNVGKNSRMLLGDNSIWWIGKADDAVRDTGPFDAQLPVLAFRDRDGKLVGTIFNHSTHPLGTLAGAVRSPSFYGLAAQDLEKEWGAPVCFLEGASGSTHNLTHGMVSAVATIKQAVSEGVKTGTEIPVRRLAAIKRSFRFKVRTFDETVEDEKVVSYVNKRANGWEYCINIFREMRRELKPEQGKERETWLQVLQIGDVAIVGVPAEFFTVLGVEIKKRSPFKRTYVAELANDWIGYLPNREGHQLGGYQTWMGLHSYAEIGTGERVVDEVVEMLNELARSK